MNATEYTGPTYGTRRTGAILHPSAKEPGKWQVTRFDEDGFSGDTQYKTRRAAEDELERDGMTPGGRLLEEIATTERFTRGNEKTYLIGMINAGGDHAALCAAYERGGLSAARAVFARAHA